MYLDRCFKNAFTNFFHNFFHIRIQNLLKLALDGFMAFAPNISKLWAYPLVPHCPDKSGSTVLKTLVVLW